MKSGKTNVATKLHIRRLNMDTSYLLDTLYMMYLLLDFGMFQRGMESKSTCPRYQHRHRIHSLSKSPSAQRYSSPCCILLAQCFRRRNGDLPDTCYKTTDRSKVDRDLPHIVCRIQRPNCCKIHSHREDTQ